MDHLTYLNQPMGWIYIASIILAVIAIGFAVKHPNMFYSDEQLLTKLLSVNSLIASTVIPTKVRIKSLKRDHRLLTEVYERVHAKRANRLKMLVKEYRRTEKVLCEYLFPVNMLPDPIPGYTPRWFYNEHVPEQVILQFGNVTDNGFTLVYTYTAKMTDELQSLWEKRIDYLVETQLKIIRIQTNNRCDDELVKERLGEIRLCIQLYG